MNVQNNTVLIYRGGNKGDHTIQDIGSGLRVTIDVWSTFLYFVIQKLKNDDFDEEVPELLTPEGTEWNPYVQSFAEREMSLKNLKREIDPPYCEHIEMIKEDDYPSLASFVALDEMVCRKDHDAVISVFKA